MGELETLAVEAATGNRAAAELLISKTYEDIYGYVSWKTRDEHLAWDLSQEAYTRAWTRLNQFDPEKGRFMAWLLRLASNVINDHYRNTRTVETPYDDVSSTGGEVLPIILARENMRELNEAIQKLDPKQRDPILLKSLHGMKFDEIAEILDVPKTTIQSRVKAGLLKLKQLLDENKERSASCKN